MEVSFQRIEYLNKMVEYQNLSHIIVFLFETYFSYVGMCAYWILLPDVFLIVGHDKNVWEMLI